MPDRKVAARILVVDDNPGVLKLLGTLLEEAGLGVRLALSAAEARQALNAEEWRFDLVLSDISMPGESGFDLLSWIKRQDSPRPDLPVLLTTAQLPEAENRIKGLAMGAVDYVVRPIELSELVLRVLNAVNHSRRVQGLERSLADSENLATVGRLLAASHHEMKNLATLVRLTAEQAVKIFSPECGSGRPIGNGLAVLAALDNSSELLADMARNVSTLLDPGSMAMRSVDLTVLADDVTKMMAVQVAPIRLEVTASPPRWAMGHALRIKQVLINLIVNAADAIRELDRDQIDGGHIVVAAEAVGEDTYLVVRDNGIGFSKAEARTEFPAFSTTKKLRGGQGLGLWLSATLIRNMGGQLTLTSEGVGKGVVATAKFASCAAPVDDFDVQRYLDELDA